MWSLYLVHQVGICDPRARQIHFYHGLLLTRRVNLNLPLDPCNLGDGQIAGKVFIESFRERVDGPGTLRYALEVLE